jgi:hypothetical protein
MTGEGFLTESKQPSEDICTCNRGKSVKVGLILGSRDKDIREQDIFATEKLSTNCP